MISVVVNLDTRPGWKLEATLATSTLNGTRSVDFFTEGLINKRKFFAGHEIELIAYVDEHEPLDVAVSGADKLVVVPHSKERYRWNDHVYLDALAHAQGDYVCHFDQDTVAFCVDGAVIEQYLKLLDSGVANFVSLPLPSERTDTYWWASTRFFITKREFLPLDEIRHYITDPQALVEKYRWPGISSFPCLEHLLGAMNAGKVLYPVQDGKAHIYSWYNYRQGVLADMNRLSYPEVCAFIESKCGTGGAGELYLK
jgi:hypothetical protein